MTSDAVKIAKINKRVAELEVTRSLIHDLVANPMIVFLAGSLGILEIQRKYGSEPSALDMFFPRGLIEKGGGIALVAGISTAMALGPEGIKTVAEAGTEGLKVLGSAAPLLAAGG
jgi:hypothetical protein